MTREQVLINHIQEYLDSGMWQYEACYLNKDDLKVIIKALEQKPCEMSAEEYRQRMIQAFHNADTDELIAVCVLPTEKEFEHLEWLLKNHYKKEPCGDCISRQAVMNCFKKWQPYMATRLFGFEKELSSLPSVTPQPKTGRWIRFKEFENGYYHIKCSECGQYWSVDGHAKIFRYCFNCGAKMEEVEEE